MNETLIKKTSKEEKISTVDYLKESHLIHYLIYLGIVTTLGATILCSIYIILLYQDVHSTYTTINDNSDLMKKVNVTHLINLINDMSAFEECFTSKFCHRKAILN